jgi:hypothetical protein
VESATFADEIKSKGGSWQSGWHFLDNPYLDQGGSIEDYPNFKFESENVATAIPHLINWISDTGDYRSSFVYQTVTSHVTNEEDAKSYALRLLIHYVGDIHQPLHATSRVDDKYPAGDRGGNNFPIPSKQTAKNLHAVWDGVVYLFTSSPSLVSTFTPPSNLKY